MCVGVCLVVLNTSLCCLPCLTLPLSALNISSSTEYKVWLLMGPCVEFITTKKEQICCSCSMSNLWHLLTDLLMLQLTLCEKNKLRLWLMFCYDKANR